MVIFLGSCLVVGASRSRTAAATPGEEALQAQQSVLDTQQQLIAKRERANALAARL